MLNLFIMMCMMMMILSYINIDPMKSSFFLIFSLLFSIPIMTFSLHIWFGYFVCLLFLSGVFVILVYFSSLSKFGFNKNYFWFFSMVLTFIYMSVSFYFYTSNLNLVGFYFNIYFVLFCFILLMLLFFMNFSSYFLNFSGALRKI